MTDSIAINLSVTDTGLTGWRTGFLILDTGRMMDGFSKFSVGVICMLAMVLLAATPKSASSHDIADTADNFVTENVPVSRQSN